MKLVCTVSVGNRLLSGVARSQNKHVKSTLALCKHPKNEDDIMIILFTTQNKVGTKYKLLNNVTCILTRFIHEGKATIQFKEPQHDMFIKADTIQLKGFLHLLRRALEKKISAKELTLSSMSVTPVPQKNIAPKKLIVKSRSQLPTKGYPRTLEALYINEIGWLSLGIGILQLQKLRVLDISNNLIEHLPTKLNNLPLEELYVQHNELGKGTLKQWDWIGGILTRNLKILNLSNNKIQCLPQKLVKLQKLTYLHVDNNNLQILPMGIGNLRSLHTLTAANNKLTFLPGTVNRLHLERLDVSNNNFKTMSVAAVFPKPLPVCSLKEYAARKVLQVKIPYNSWSIPYTLVEYLDCAFYCVCGKACLDVYLNHPNIINLNCFAQSFVTTMGESGYVPVDCYYCSSRCFRIKHNSRN